jgi:transcriptional regulator of acetoin/glycerol metabolism
MIVQHFIRNNAAKSGKRILGLTPEAMERLSRYPWPGNVRELRNAIEYAFVLCPSGGIGKQHLPPKIVGDIPECPQAATGVGNGDDDGGKAALIRVLRQAGGNQSEAGRLMGVSRVTIWKRIKKYGIDVKREIRG